MTPDQIAGWIQIGGAGLMLGALFLGFKKVWVWGWLYQQVVDERDYWRALAMRGMDATVTAMTTPLTTAEANAAQKVIQNSGR